MLQAASGTIDNLVSVWGTLLLPAVLFPKPLMLQLAFESISGSRQPRGKRYRKK